MTQYINKSALVAEINRQHKILMQTDHTYGAQFVLGFRQACRQIIDFLDTLEVKEVDLNEHQISDIIQNLFPTDQFIESETLLLSRKEAILFAKHFFELGLKAQKGE